MIYHKTEYRERRDHFAVLRLLGRARRLRHAARALPGAVPAAGTGRSRVERGRSGDSIAHGWAPIGSHHVELSLAPGETREIVFVLGYAENPREQKFDPPGSQTIDKRRVRPVIDRYLASGRGRAALSNGCASTGSDLLEHLQVDDAERAHEPHGEHLERLPVHGHVQHVALGVAASSRASAAGWASATRTRTCSASSTWSRSGRASGSSTSPPRSCRPAAPTTSTSRSPSAATTTIGSGFNDDPLWLILGVAAYLKETGDRAILDEPVPFDNEPGSETPLLRAPAALAPLHARAPRPARAAADRPRGLERLPEPQLLLRDARRVVPDDGEPRGQASPSRCSSPGCSCSPPRSSPRSPSTRIWRPRPPASAPSATGWQAAVREHGWDGEWFLRAYDYFGEHGRLEGERGGPDLHRAAGHLRDGRHRARGREGRRGARLGRRAPRDAARHRAATARLLALPRRAGRDLLVPARLQGERRHLLPQQPLGHDRRDARRRRRPGVRLLPAHQPVGARGDERRPPLRALRLRADDRRQGRADARRGQELVAHRHRRLELRRDHAVDPRRSGPSTTGCGSTPACRRAGTGSTPSGGSAARPTTSRCGSREAGAPPSSSTTARSRER